MLLDSLWNLDVYHCKKMFMNWSACGIRMCISSLCDLFIFDQHLCAKLISGISCYVYYCDENCFNHGSYFVQDN